MGFLWFRGDLLYGGRQFWWEDCGLQSEMWEFNVVTAIETGSIRFVMRITSESTVAAQLLSDMWDILHSGGYLHVQLVELNLMRFIWCRENLSSARKSINTIASAKSPLGIWNVVHTVACPPLQSMYKSRCIRRRRPSFCRFKNLISE